MRLISLLTQFIYMIYHMIFLSQICKLHVRCSLPCPKPNKTKNSKNNSFLSKDNNTIFYLDGCTKQDMNSNRDNKYYPNMICCYANYSLMTCFLIMMKRYSKRDTRKFQKIKKDLLSKSFFLRSFIVKNFPERNCSNIVPYSRVSRMEIFTSVHINL